MLNDPWSAQTVEYWHRLRTATRAGKWRFCIRRWAWCGLEQHALLGQMIVVGALCSSTCDVLVIGSGQSPWRSWEKRKAGWQDDAASRTEAFSKECRTRATIDWIPSLRVDTSWRPGSSRQGGSDASEGQCARKGLDKWAFRRACPDHLTLRLLRCGKRCRDQPLPGQRIAVTRRAAMKSLAPSEGNAAEMLSEYKRCARTRPPPPTASTIKTKRTIDAVKAQSFSHLQNFSNPENSLIPTSGLTIFFEKD